MATLPWVRLSSIVEVYSSEYSKSPDIGLHSRVAFAPPIASHCCVFGGIRKENVHEGILIPRSRLCLRPAQPDATDTDRPDPSGPGPAAACLPADGDGVGGRPQLSQSAASPTAHRAGRATAGLCRWA